MDKDRRTAFLILKSIELKKEWANIAISGYLKSEGAVSPAFVRELTYGVLRNISLLDYNIDRFLKKPKIGTSERIWLRMGFYQLACMDGVSEYAAVNETVGLASGFKKGSEGFINAVLRNFQRSGKELLYPDKSNKNYLDIRYSVCREVSSLLVKSYGPENAENILAASNTPAPLCIRVNTLKTDKKALSEMLSERGYELSSEGILSSDALYVKGSDLLGTDCYKEGLFSVQGDSSQYALRLLSPAPGSTVIDLCAAPGGKSCAMAEMMEGRGRILAFDLHEHRKKLIEKEASRLGIGIIEAAVMDSSVYDPSLCGIADYVLADVPCSGLGTLREKPEIKYRKPEISDVQGKILENALRYVRKGGYVLYSTCSIDPRENEDVIKNCSLIDSSALKGTRDGSREYKVIASRQLLTKKNAYDGFYMCLIQRSSN